MRINVLEPEIFNKIAAGEVVERPASIIKELVENSVDSGATNVTIEIENGGISKIKVTDNGCGIFYDDLVKAFMPHATSKIKTSEDLFEIKTLGFRGEALASIGAVANVELISKPAEATSGGKIEISGGKTGLPQVCGCANGTIITVENLFFNVPARAKFLKKPKTEEVEITNLVEKTILANPCVSFKYIIDGKIKCLSSGKGMQDAMYEVYNKDTLDNCLYFEQQFSNMRIYGYASKPNFTKPNRTYQTIILNNRYIQNSTISSAVMSAYGEVLMKKQFPLFVIYVELDYASVDVNVHPNKLEVRFENGGQIYKNVFETLNRAINSIDYTRELVSQEQPSAVSLDLPDFSNEVVIENKSETVAETPLETKRSSYSGFREYSSSKPSAPQKEVENFEKLYDNTKNLIKTNSEQVKNIFSAISSLSSQEDCVASGLSFGSRMLNEVSEQQSISEETVVSTLKVVGVVFNTYIIAELGDNMLVIDQHAGHERVLFDRLIRQVESQRISSQPMLVPYILNLNAIECDYVLTNISELQNLGFEIDEFGDNAFKITAVPYILEEINLKEFFNEFLSEMKEPKSFAMANTVRDKIASMACKSAVKAGDKLSQAEINYLLELFKIENTRLLCPHGRPIVIQISQKEIEKWFKRIV